MLNSSLKKKSGERRGGGGRGEGEVKGESE